MNACTTDPSDDLTLRLIGYLDPDADPHDAHVHGTLLQSAIAEGAQVVRPGDLLGPNDAAELLEQHRTTISRWKKQGYLPPPFQEVAGVAVWTRATLERFKADHLGRADAAGRRPVGTAAR